MNELYGWVGKILRVDLTTGEITDVPTSNYVPRFIGGEGICAKVAWDELPPEVGAFDPENRITFMTGPMAGTLAPASTRMHIGFISPMSYPTEDYVRTNIGGHWAAELKFAGYDGIIVQGKATKPVWIWVNDGKAEIRDAAKYWGLDLYSTEEAIWHDLGSRKVQVVGIGPAGENLVRYAVVGTDNGDFAGVGGAGAVMGSKNLKAIAVRGTKGIEVAKPDELAEEVFRVHRLMLRPEARPPLGLDQIGSHRMGSGGSTDVTRKDFLKENTIKGGACFGCPIACKTIYRSPGGIKPAITQFCGAQWYRSLDVDKHGKHTSTFVKVSGLTDALGIDTQQVKQMAKKWLKACYKKGLLTPEETGIPLDNQGEYEWAESLLNKIAYREGFGDILAEGMCRASETLGIEIIEETGADARGFGVGYKPRMWPTNSLLGAMESSHRKAYYHSWAARMVRKNEGYSGGTAWATVDEWYNVLTDVLGREDIIDHRGDAYYEPNKAWLAKWYEDFRGATCEAMEFCEWAISMWWSWYSKEPNRKGFSPDAEPKMFSLATGVDMDRAAMLKAGERIKNLHRAIQVREGRRRNDDKLADWFFTKSKTDLVPGPDGVYVSQTRALDRDKFEKLKDYYYTERGWDLVTGIPTRAKLEELDMKDVADELESAIGALP